MSTNVRGAALLFAITTTIGAAGSAQAEFFVRPVLQYSGELQDGLSLNALSSNSATFYDGSTALEAHVDLEKGTIKTFAEHFGPSDTFIAVTGIMGDQIRYTGAQDVAVTFHYDFDASIFADQTFTGTPPEFDNRYIGIEAHFAVYEAGSGANWADWTSFGTQSGKDLYVDYKRTNFQDYGESFATDYASGFSTDLFLTSGKSYDIFAAFNLILTPGAMTGQVTMNALNTSTIGVEAPGGEFTSQSGKFLNFAQTTSAVPEPASWAMLIAGFFITGATLRSRNALRVARI